MKHNYIKTLVTCFIAVAVFASSCQKENGVDNLGGEATVTINMRGIGLSTGNKAKAGLRASANAGNTMATPAVQRQVVKFNNQFNVTATLREVTPASTPALRASANRAETTATGVGEVLPLTDGTAYTIVISQGGEVVTTETFTQGEGEHKFNIDAGSYTYVAYAYGDASASGADKDPLWVSGSFSVTAGENNTLSIVLEHKLTEVTVVFDAGAGRTINAIGAGTLAPNHSYEFNEATGAVTFGTATTAAAVSFTGQTAGQIWTSNPTMIAVEETDNGVVELSNVTINNTPGSITSDGWALRAGVQYRLELNLGDKEEEGIDIGGSTWSSGNLEYNPETGEYGFGSDINSIGNYWFANRVKPKVVRDDVLNYNQAPNDAINGTAGEQGGDPCALVAPAGNWRLPKVQEILDLINITATNPPSRWVASYDGISATNRGIFFGVATDHSGGNFHPGADKDNYVFWTLSGYYSNDDTSLANTFGKEGSYIVRADDGTFREWHFTGAADGIAYSVGGSWSFSQEIPVGRASQIRCVQN